jgi:hypothetical protein
MVLDSIEPPNKHSKLEQYISNSFECTSNGDSSQVLEELTNNYSTNGDNADKETYWVTIFGFPPGKQRDILELFSRHGDIVAKKVIYLFLMSKIITSILDSGE